MSQSSARSASLRRNTHTKTSGNPTLNGLLGDLQLTHGPIEDIARYLLRCEQHIRHLGITLSFGTFEELRRTNRSNSATWRPLVPVLDPTCNALPPDQAFCILGRDADGAIVATQAARLLDMTGTTLLAEAQSLRMFYEVNRPEDWDCTLSAPSAPHITGRVAYSGGVWYHPRLRGNQLSSVLPRMSRLLALSRWDTQFSISFVEDILIKKGMPARYGYPRAEPQFLLTDMRHGDCVFSGGLIWIDRQETLADLELLLADSALQVDIIAHARGA